MKQLKKTAVVLMIFLLMLGSVNMNAFGDNQWDGTTVRQPSGTGDPETPFLIATPEELAWFGAQLKTDNTLCAKLIADIDLNNKPWTPMCSEPDKEPTSLPKKGKAFAGVFDGNDHTISGLYINITADETNYRYIGLFGASVGASKTSYACIKNLTVKGNITIDVTNKMTQYIAGICGACRYLEITNCISDVAIKTVGSKSGSAVGGIVGYAFGPVKITNCANKGNIDVNLEAIGGLVGVGSSASNVIACSYNLGNISGDTKIGGLCGQIAGEVKDCYNSGNVTAFQEDTQIGGSAGLVGSNYTSTKLSLTNCFVTGGFYSEYENYTGAVYGNIVGNTNDVVILNNVYYLENVNSRPCGINAMQYNPDNPLYDDLKTTVMTAEQISSDAFVTTLNVNSGSTVFKKGSSHPIFVWQTEDVPIPVVTLGDIDENGMVNAEDVSEFIVRIANNNAPDVTVADMNSDGMVNAEDVIGLIMVITTE